MKSTCEECNVLTKVYRASDYRYLCYKCIKKIEGTNRATSLSAGNKQNRNFKSVPDNNQQ